MTAVARYGIILYKVISFQTPSAGHIKKRKTNLEAYVIFNSFSLSVYIHIARESVLFHAIAIKRHNSFKSSDITRPNAVTTEQARGRGDELCRAKKKKPV
jgi:hypothetical protein